MVEDRQNALNLLSITAKGPCADSATAVDFILGFADYHPSGQHRQRISGPFMIQRGPLNSQKMKKINSERKAAEKARGVLALLSPTAAYADHIVHPLRLAGWRCQQRIAASNSISLLAKCLFECWSWWECRSSSEIQASFRLAILALCASGRTPPRGQLASLLGKA
jgi:hypothetical protein